MGYNRTMARHLRYSYYRSGLHYRIAALVKGKSPLSPSTSLKDPIEIGEIGHLDNIIF